jgi:hypothetical protein
LLLGEWQQIVETILLKERVSAREQKAIKRGFVGKATGGRDLVDPDADSPDHARPPQFIKGAIRSVQCLAKSAFIGLGGPVRPDIDVVK